MRYRTAALPLPVRHGEPAGAAQVCLGLQTAEHPGFGRQFGEVECVAVGESVPRRQDDVQGVFHEWRPLQAGTGDRPDG